MLSLSTGTETQISQTNQSPRWFSAFLSPWPALQVPPPLVPMGVLPSLAFAVASGSGLCSVLLLVHLNPDFHSTNWAFLRGPFAMGDGLEVWCLRGGPGSRCHGNRRFSSWGTIVPGDHSAVESKCSVSGFCDPSLHTPKSCFATWFKLII